MLQSSRGSARSNRSAGSGTSRRSNASSDAGSRQSSRSNTSAGQMYDLRENRSRKTEEKRPKKTASHGASRKKSSQRTEESLVQRTAATTPIELMISPATTTTAPEPPTADGIAATAEILHLHSPSRSFVRSQQRSMGLGSASAGILSDYNLTRQSISSQFLEGRSVVQSEPGRDSTTKGAGASPARNPSKGLLSDGPDMGVFGVGIKGTWTDGSLGHPHDEKQQEKDRLPPKSLSLHDLLPPLPAHPWWSLRLVAALPARRSSRPVSKRRTATSCLMI